MSKRTLLWFGLPLAFIVSFAVPLFLGVGGERVRQIFWGAPAPIAAALADNGLNISRAGEYIRVKHAEDLNPLPGKDFALVVWFNMKRFPSPGQRLVLLSKYDFNHNERSGYALALSKEANALRPSIFWSDGKNAGRWYDFSNVGLSPRNWFGLVLTFRETRYLGMHLIEIKPDGSAQPALLGGYDLGSGSGAQMGEADLIGGAIQDRPFRGAIGPLGIYARKHLSLRLDQFLMELAADPVKPPAFFKKNEQRFWTVNWREDASHYHHKIEAYPGSANDKSKKADGGQK